MSFFSKILEGFIIRISSKLKQGIETYKNLIMEYFLPKIVYFEDFLILFTGIDIYEIYSFYIYS